MNKKSNKKQDTISQLKKEENKAVKDKKNEEEEEYEEEEEEKNQNQNVIKEQTAQKTDKPKNLKDLLGSMGDNKPKPKKAGNKKKAKQYEEPGKLTFINSKGTGNADKIDKEGKKFEKKVFKNAKGLDAAAKENEKIKHTKDYLEKDTEKKYKDEKEENIAKPQFKTNIKEGDENFVELNKNEDVSIYIFLSKFFFVSVIS